MLRREGNMLSICACNISRGVCNVVSSGALLAIDIVVWYRFVVPGYACRLVANPTSMKGSNKDSYVTDDIYVNPPGSIGLFRRYGMHIRRCSEGVIDEGRYRILLSIA